MNSSSSTSTSTSSASSTPHRRPNMTSGLTRYVSAPSSLLKSLAASAFDEDQFSTVGSDPFNFRFFSGDSSDSASKPLPTSSAALAPSQLDRSYAFNDLPLPTSADPSAGDFPPSAAATATSLKGVPTLIRHSSSPAGFISQLSVDNGFSVTRGLGNGNYSSQPGYDGSHGMRNSRLKSQLSFSRQDSLSQISEVSIPDVGESVAGHNGSDDTAGNVGQSYMSGNFPLGSWDDTNSIVFSAPPTKRAKDINGNIITGIGSLETQFSLPQTSLEMATVEKLFQMQPDSVPCKIRAKRGCATHPRSIAERDRRTRISEKLKKLQDLVPNMDKQTNTAEMLDLAVQHIKTLQNQVQMLKQEHANCTCGCHQAV